MTAITVSFTAKNASRIAVGKPVTTGMFHDLWDNDQYSFEYLGGVNFTPIQDHDHDGVNSKAITLRYPFWRDFGDGSDGSVTHSTNGSIGAGLYNYINFTINNGITLSQNTRGPLVIRCTGVCTINGTLDANYMGGAPSFSDLNSNWVPPEGNTYNPNDAAKAYDRPRRFIAACGGTGGGLSSGALFRSGASILTAGAISTTGSTPAASARLMALAINGPFWGGTGGLGSISGPTIGAGGGSVLILADTITFNSGAVISAIGQNGAVSGNYGNAGGGGGVIVFACKTLSADAGTKNVSGGTGASAAIVSGFAGGAGWTTNIQV